MSNQRLLLILLSVFFTILTPASSASAQAQEKPPQLVESVDIVGNRRLRKEDILYYVQTRAGDTYNEAQVQRDLQGILALGFFLKTETRVVREEGVRGGVNIIFYVKELPIVRELLFEGLKAVAESDVLKAFRERRVGISKESIYDPVKSRNAIRVLKELLASKGYPNASISVSQSEVSATSNSITFRIDEGERVRVVEIQFEGNQAFSDGALRRQLKLVKEAGLISRFKGQDILDREKLDYDLRNVTNYMRSKGYLQARLGEPKIDDLGRRRTGLPVLPVPFLSSTDAALRITVPVIEGKVYRVGEMKIQGNSIVSEQQIVSAIGLNPGDVANGERLGKALYEDLKKFYGTQGFIQYTAEPEPTFRDNPKDPNEGIVDFLITIEEGKQFSLRRLEFIGNTFTRDYVMRREFLLNEGDIYNQTLFEYSVLRLNQLGYFDPIEKEKDVDYKTNEEEAQVDASVKVAERGRQQISFNGGTGGTSGAFFGLEYSTNNLLGRGETLSLNLSAGSQQRSVQFSFTQPYVRNRPIQAGFTLFSSSAKYYGDGTLLSQNSAAQSSYIDYLSGSTTISDTSSLFTRITNGGSVFLSAPLSEFYRKRRFTQFSRIGLSYALSQSSVKDPEVNSEGDSATFIPVVYAQSNIISSSVTGTFAFDTRNGSIDPTQGREISFALSLAGLGGDVRTYQPSLSYSQFIPIRNKKSQNPQVFAFRIIAGHIGSFAPTTKIREAQTNSLSFINGVPIYSRYFLGGDDSIRGYDTRSIAPISRFQTSITSRNVTVANNATGTADPVVGLPQSVIDELARLGTFTGIGGSNPGLVSTYYSAIGGDSQLLGNFEYRIPIAGPVQLAAFADIGTVFNLRKISDQTYSSAFLTDQPFLESSFGTGFGLNTLVIANNPLYAHSAFTGGIVLRGAGLVSQEDLNNALRFGPVDPLTGLPVGFYQAFLRGEAQTNTAVNLASSLYSKWSALHSSIGMEFRVQVPIINVPFRLIYAYNPNARNGTYDPGLTFTEKRNAFRFSVGRTF
ncbi:MAG TPA: outer membrane protein assembly factor BamA [Pyrinomonadaceae bacterium]|nr:outer membrane protein assembly factor BamA [Pyrinomonadaceae bacterium]